MKENRAFLILHAVLLAFVLIGFGRSFYLAPLFGDPAGLDTPLRIHGWVLTACFTITVAQGWLVLKGQRARHRSLAWLAGLIAVGVVATGLWIKHAPRPSRRAGRFRPPPWREWLRSSDRSSRRRRRRHGRGFPADPAAAHARVTGNGRRGRRDPLSGYLISRMDVTGH